MLPICTSFAIVWKAGWAPRRMSRLAPSRSRTRSRSSSSMLRSSTGSDPGIGRGQADRAAGKALEKTDVDAGLAEHGGIEVAAHAAMVEGDDDHVGAAAAGEVGAVFDAAVGVAGVDVGGAELGLELELEPDERMIEQKIADG